MTRLLIALAIFAGGCSIIYNPDNIASKQDAAVFDANPSNLMLADLGPTEILEGQGDGGSRPAVLVIHGDNFVVGAKVELMAGTTVHIDVDNTKVQVSHDTHYLAVPVTAHVDDAIPDGMMVPLTVKVTQPVPGGGMVSQMLAGQLSLHGLDTLTGSIGNCALLKPLYASIQTTGTVALTSNPSKPCVFRAVASVAMGDLTARGVAGSGTTGGGPGPGGCKGGDGLVRGECGTHGGGGAVGGTLVAGGGGGGGFATDGNPGTGTGPGAPGLAFGDTMIASYAMNIPSGGGGGAQLLNTAGGGGGGSGGIVEVTAGGDLVVGMIDASGGAGGTSGGAGGGGGAGGAIVVRAGGTITTGKLQAAPGAKGGNGGDGSAGRIRWEALSGMPAATSTPAPAQGVSFVADTPFAITSQTAEVALVGTSTTMFNVYSKDAAGHETSGATVSIAGSGMAMTNLPVVHGYNSVCITLANGTHGSPESERCVDIAYLP